MPETETLTLPLLPLTTGVVLPQMVVTLALETDEARTPPRARSPTDRRVLLVPRVGTGYARVGTIARIENEGDLPGGGRPSSCAAWRGRSSAPRCRPSTPASGSRPSPSARRPPSPAGRGELAREYRADRARDRRAARLARASPTRSPASPTPAPSPTPPGWSPDLSVERKVELLETLDVEARLEKALALGARRAGRARADGPDPQRGQRRHGEDPTRVPAAPAARPRSARSWARRRRRGRGRGVPRAARGSASFPRRRATRSTREVDRLERTSEQSPEHGWIRTWIDTVLELPWGTRSDDQLDDQ